MSKSLESRRLGPSGDTVTIVGLGGAFLNKHSFDEGVRTIHRALELGVSFFDTAPAYGGVQSQLIVGEALEGRREPYTLATKLSRSRSAEALWDQLADNLKKLRRDRIDVLHAHEAEYAAWWADDVPHNQVIEGDHEYEFADAPIMHVLRDAKQKGLCRYSGMAADRGDALVQILRNVSVDVCLSAHQYTLLHRESPGIVRPVAVEQNIPYIVAAVFQRIGVPSGNLADERLDEFVQSSGQSAARLSIRYLIGDPAVTTILIGASNPEEIEECVDAALDGPLPVEQRAAIDRIAEAHAER